MKTKRKFLCLLLCACTAASLFAGCSKNGPDAGHTGTQRDTQDQTSSQTDSQRPAQDQNTAQTDSQPSATLFIGTKENGFAEYPLDCDGQLTPEILIQGIADLTGWDLSLSEPVISGKGGISVCLSENSSLFAGPPDPQKDEFHMFDAVQLAQTILDSIQKTLQENFTGEGGNPDTLDIWYYMQGEQPLSLPEIDRFWPIDEPYQWDAGQK